MNLADRSEPGQGLGTPRVRFYQTKPIRRTPRQAHGLGFSGVSRHRKPIANAAILALSRLPRRAPTFDPRRPQTTEGTCGTRYARLSAARYHDTVDDLVVE